MAFPRLKIMAQSRWAIHVVLILAISAGGFATTVFSADSKSAVQKPVKHTWNLQDADILSVINTVSRETGKNFVIDPRVTGKVTLISSVALGADELYPVFLSILNVYGFAAVSSGDIIKIVPNLEAIKENPALASDAEPGKGNEIVVRVVPTHNVAAQQVMTVLRPLLPQWSYVSAYSPSNIIILSGPASTLSRLVAVIQDIDKAADNDVDVIPLKTANASQVVEILQKLQSEHRDLRNKAGLVADTRNNQILISGDRMLRFRMRALISQLDQSNLKGGEGSQVVYLHYLKAKDFAPILEKIAQGTEESKNKGAGVTAATPKNTVQVQAEESTNSLIITAPLNLMRSLERVVEQLDVRPAQVLVQAIIVELSSSATEKLGIQWGSVNDDGTATDSEISGTNSTLEGGTGVGVIRSGNFRVLLTAIKGISNADILSQPTIVVLDNKKAVFSVGKQVSIIDSETGAANSATAEGIPFTTSSFSRQDVGLELDVTPQIGQGNSVQLLIKQKNDNLQNPDNPGDTPIVNSSEIDTSVIVNSGDILVLGGLMQNTLTDSVSSTPFLNKIPLLGKLFDYKQHSLEKKNLLVFIHPIILKTPLDGTRISESRYKTMRNIQQYWHDHWLEDEDNVKNRELPPRHELLKLPVPF